MITKTTHVTLFVNDQDAALKFYTEKLGFKVHTDTMWENFRWLTLNPAGQKDFEIALMPATTPEEKALVGKQGGTKPFMCLASDDCYKDYKQLKDRGVTMLAEPKEQPWGIEVLFKDLYGNVFDLVQTKG